MLCKLFDSKDICHSIELLNMLNTDHKIDYLQTRQYIACHLPEVHDMGQIYYTIHAVENIIFASHFDQLIVVAVLFSYVPVL